MLRWWYIECVALGALRPLQNSYSNLVMDHLQNHCKDSLLILSQCQHQKLAGYFCLGRCTFCCKGLFFLCLPCSQVMLSTFMQKEIFDSLYYDFFFPWEKKGEWKSDTTGAVQLLVNAFPDGLLWAFEGICVDVVGNPVCMGSERKRWWEEEELVERLPVPYRVLLCCSSKSPWIPEKLF